MSTEPVQKYLNSKGYKTETIDVIDGIPSKDSKLIVSNYSWASNKLKTRVKINIPSVYIFHGISVWKPLQGHYKGFDYAFLASEHERGKNFIHEEGYPKEENTFVTGWPKLDILYTKIKDQAEIKKEVIKNYNLDPSKPIIAYLPTFKHTDERISGAAEKLKSPHFAKIKNLIISIHNFDKTKSVIKEAMKNYPNIWNHPNKYDLLVAADIIIGDLSSVLVESLALDKPIIHLVHKRKRLTMYQKEHFGICEFGDVCTDPKELQALININIAKDIHKEKRNEWKKKMIYNFGSSTQTAGDKIISIYEKHK
jgi:hypothetical protein